MGREQGKRKRGMKEERGEKKKGETDRQLGTDTEIERDSR